MFQAEDRLSPRKGLAGISDRLMGPGASRGELCLSLVPALLGAVILIAVSQARGIPWQWWQTALAALLAFDIIGGIATNATPSAKRWFFRKGQGALNHFGFVSSHIGHIFIVAWLFMDMDLVFLAQVSGFLIISAALILAVPRRLRASASLLLCALGVTLSLYLFPQPLGLEWFAPFLFIKLLVSHLSPPAF